METCRRCLRTSAREGLQHLPQITQMSYLVCGRCLRWSAADVGRGLRQLLFHLQAVGGIVIGNAVYVVACYAKDNRDDQ